MDAGSSSSLQLPRQFRQFTISEIESATENFDESLVIGRGGFGKVYKGIISDLVVAIKRLDPTSNQGAAEFWAEVQMLSKLRHCYLVSSIGYCNDGEEMVLVYEYMLHGTLEEHLHKFQSPLPWVRRLKICIGAAKGLDYLHTNPNKRPTMAEVVVCLESVLTLQEKASSILHTVGMTVFGNKVPMFLSSFSGYKSVGSKRSLELYFDTIGGENRILRKFEYGTIKIATEDFSKNNRIPGWYNSGSMYKGRLQNGQGVSIAVFGSEFRSKYYKNEVALLVKLEHENLLNLLGYSIEGTEVFLVYEFALYERLDSVIDDHEYTLFDWNKRNKIILGVARALLYLHQYGPFRVIHRDVRPQNILLDESLHPKLSSFGFARCLAINEADCIQEENIPRNIDPIRSNKKGTALRDQGTDHSYS